MERAAEVLGAWAEWTKDAPEEVTSVGRLLQIPPIPEMPEPLRGRQVVVVEAAFLGDEQAGRELLRPLRELGPELDTFAMVPARCAHAAPPGPAGAGAGTRRGLDARRRSTPLRPQAIVDAAAMDGTAPLISVEVRHLEGALGRPDPNGGVLSHLEAPYVMYSVGDGAEPGGRSPAIDGRIAAIRGAAEPWLSRSTYFNFAERNVGRERALPGRSLRRLVEIRAEVDPDGVFRAKHAID